MRVTDLGGESMWWKQDEEDLQVSELACSRRSTSKTLHVKETVCHWTATKATLPLGL